MDKKKLQRLAAVLHDATKPGACEASVAILKGMDAGEQNRAGAEFPHQIAALAAKFPRVAQECPVAAEAAQDTIDLGL